VGGKRRKGSKRVYRAVAVLARNGAWAVHIRVPNSPTGQVLEAGPGWTVLVMAVTGPD